MKVKIIYMLKKGDIILLVSVLVIAAGYMMFIMYRGDNEGVSHIAVIRHKDEIVDIINLDSLKQAKRITISGDYEVNLVAEKGRIRFEKSDCPDKLCVNTGWLTKKGDVAVCLPNRIIVKIEGARQDVDGGSY
jgi:hypothetical protein